MELLVDDPVFFGFSSQSLTGLTNLTDVTDVTEVTDVNTEIISPVCCCSYCNLAEYEHFLPPYVTAEIVSYSLSHTATSTNVMAPVATTPYVAVPDTITTDALPHLAALDAITPYVAIPDAITYGVTVSVATTPYVATIDAITYDVTVSVATTSYVAAPNAITDNVQKKKNKKYRYPKRAEISDSYNAKPRKTLLSIIGLLHLFNNKIPFDVCPSYMPRKSWTELMDIQRSNQLVHIVSFSDDNIRLNISEEYDALVHTTTLNRKSSQKMSIRNTRFRWWNHIIVIDARIKCNNNTGPHGSIIRTICLPTEIVSNEYLQQLFKKNRHIKLLELLSYFFTRLLENLYSENLIERFYKNNREIEKSPIKYECDPKHALKLTLKEFTLFCNSLIDTDS